MLTRALRVPDRVALHLLGDDRPDPQLVPILAGSRAPVESWFPAGDVPSLARAIRAGARLTYIREPAGGGRELAELAFGELGAGALSLDLTRLPAEADLAAVAATAAREARFRDAGLVAGPIDGPSERAGQLARAFAELPWPVALTGRGSWDPAWSRSVPLEIEAAAPAPEDRGRIWEAQVPDERAPGLDPAEVTGRFRLGPEQVSRAASAAQLQAHFSGRPLDAEHLRAGARAQDAAGLARLSRRIEPRVGWGDLVLRAEVITQLGELTARLRHRERVLDEWAVGRGSSRGRGITALFAGESRTGKTLAAEVIAADAGLDLYVIDLATVIDKYIGETEKNLERIFSAAEHVNGVLLFDEADALFGKRSEVRDARDRYANVEVAYLLQRMELFDGMAILTTNLRGNLDEAFTRRLDAVVDFPTPNAEARRRLWSHHLGSGAPLASDIDVDLLADKFDLPGGNIRNITLAAAYLAADAGTALGMAEVIRATQREYRKLGRLLVEPELDAYTQQPRADPRRSTEEGD